MSGGLPLGTRYDPTAPWNLPEPEYKEGQCPDCESFNTFEAKTYIKKKQKKMMRHVCRECWGKFE